jgi:hypothetical protein
MKQLQFIDHRRCWKCCPSTWRYLLQLTDSLENTGTTILALTAHQTQLSLDGAGLHGLDVDSVNSIVIILRIYVSLQVKPCFIRKECQL